MSNTHETLVSLFEDCADAIREKDGTSSPIVADLFPEKIRAIPQGGGDITVESLSVSANGTYTAPAGKAYSPVVANVPQGVFPTGTKTITENGTYDVTNFASAAVSVPGGGGGIPLPSTITAGDTPVVVNASGVAGSSSSYNNLKATGLKITIPKNGNYRIKWCTSNAITSSTGTPPSCQSRLYKNGSAIGTAVTVNAGRETVSTYNGDFNAGDVIEVWLKNGHQSLGIATLYHGGVSNLMACINWDISKLWE